MGVFRMQAIYNVLATLPVFPAETADRKSNDPLSQILSPSSARAGSWPHVRSGKMVAVTARHDDEGNAGDFGTANPPDRQPWI